MTLFILFVFLIYSVNGDDSATPNNTVAPPLRDKFLQNLYKIAQNNHDVATSDEQIDRFPTEALSGIYVECILGLSFPCLQKKFIHFLYKLDKMRNIDLIGNSIAVVRKPQRSSDTTVLAKIAEYVDQTYLKDIIDHLIDKFFDNHVLRVKIPPYFQENSEQQNEATFVDIDFGVEKPLTSRDGKSGGHGHGGHGKLRGLKKLMMLIGLLTCMKMAMMGPLMLALIGLKAMKALILAVMSITISKMMLLGKSNLSVMFGGHDGGSGGHGGWDRTIQEQYTSTSSLPYHMEPPVPYNSYSVH